MFWFVLILILLGGGFYFYQRMVALEQEIRAEQVQEKEQQQASQGSTKTSPAVPLTEQPAQPAADSTLPAASDDMVENPVERLICMQPGVIQADLYAQLPQLGKKQVQQMVRELVDAGKVRRERLGSSFKLYLV